MRRKMILLVTALLLISVMLSACGKSEEVKIVESLISEIGTVDENSEKAIQSAEKAYDQLTDEEKNKVDNYNTLLSARKEYDAIPKDIDLTTSNISDYLEIGLSYGKYETHKSIGIDFTNVDVYLSVYPVVNASFSNVEITAEVTCPANWSVNSSDSAYQEADSSKMTLSFRLPSNGQYDETHTIGRAMWAAAPERDCSIRITSVKGTVTTK